MIRYHVPSPYLPVVQAFRRRPTLFVLTAATVIALGGGCSGGSSGHTTDQGPGAQWQTDASSSDVTSTDGVSPQPDGQASSPDASDGETGEATTAPETGSRDDAGLGAAELIQRVCDKQAACCPGNQSPQDCVSAGTESILPLFTLPSIAIDQQELGACMDLVSGLSCEVVAHYGGRIPFDRLCQPFHHGTQTVGSPCGGNSIVESLYDDDQCASGTCLGSVCVAFAQEGESCKLGIKCASPLTCVNEVCVPPKTEGQACASPSECTLGLQCFESAATGDHACQKPAPIQIGEECVPGTQCELGSNDDCSCPPDELGCTWGYCGNPKACKQ